MGILLLKGSLVTSVLNYPENFFHVVTFMKGPLTVKCLTVTSHEIKFFFVFHWKVSIALNQGQFKFPPGNTQHKAFLRLLAGSFQKGPFCTTVQGSRIIFK